MDLPWLVAAALAFGVLVGAGLLAVVILAADRGQRALDLLNDAVPDGVDQVVEVLDPPGW